MYETVSSLCPLFWGFFLGSLVSSDLHIRLSGDSKLPLCLGFVYLDCVYTFQPMTALITLI